MSEIYDNRKNIYCQKLSEMVSEWQFLGQRWSTIFYSPLDNTYLRLKGHKILDTKSVLSSQ